MSWDQHEGPAHTFYLVLHIQQNNSSGNFIELRTDSNYPSQGSVRLLTARAIIRSSSVVVSTACMPVTPAFIKASTYRGLQASHPEVFVCSNKHSGPCPSHPMQCCMQYPIARSLISKGAFVSYFYTIKNKRNKKRSNSLSIQF